ncbi:MAG: ATP-binding protein [Chloroflexota bacterium]
MNKFYNNLSFRIGVIIILVEMVVLTALGVIYINRFSNQVDRRIETQVQLPGMLMNAGLLSFDSVSDPATMRKLVGDELTTGLVVGVNGNVFYALDPDHLAMDVTDIPSVDATLFNIENPQDLVIHNPQKVISVTPIFAADQRTPRFFVYVEVSNLAATAEKNALTRLFVLGSLATILLTSMVIIISFNRMILFPISRLAGALKRVESGDLTSRVQQTKGQDEIGTLQRSTNTMIVALEKNQVQIRHLNRILRAIRNVNQLITQERDLDLLLEKTCIHLTETDKYEMAWILLVDDAENPIKFVQKNKQGETLSLSYLLEQGGLMACAKTCLAQHGVQIFSDHSEPCKDCLLFAKYDGPYKEMAIRLEFDGRVYGLLNITVVSEVGIDTEEVSLFKEVAGDISFALYSLELEEKRVSAESELRESEERLKEAQRIGNLGSLDWNLVTDRILLSDEALIIYGLTRDKKKITPARITDLAHPEDKEQVKKCFNNTITKNEKYDIEHRIINPDGTLRYIWATAELYRDESGKPVRFLETILDITERMKAEKEIHTLNAELEKRVQERTTQLESANKELEAFSYSVSHDLRAPLRGIDGWSLALLEDYGSQLDGKAKPDLERVRSETQHMGQLIDDLLQLSRLTRSEMNVGEVNLSSMVGAIMAQLQKSQPDRQVEIIIQPGLHAKGDPRLLEIALTNLLNNAFKFTGKTPQGCIQFGQTKMDGQPTFFVRDNGAGFDMTSAKKLFGAFQRMHKASDFPGSGIGLTTIQRIVHRHGGRIWAEAAVDQGATFYFTLEENP